MVYRFCWSMENVSKLQAYYTLFDWISAFRLQIGSPILGRTVTTTFDQCFFCSCLFFKLLKSWLFNGIGFRFCSSWFCFDLIFSCFLFFFFEHSRLLSITNTYNVFTPFFSYVLIDFSRITQSIVFFHINLFYTLSWDNFRFCAIIKK